MKAWCAASDHEFAFEVEDGIDVSSLYHEFVKVLIPNYSLPSLVFGRFVPATVFFIHHCLIFGICLLVAGEV